MSPSLNFSFLCKTGPVTCPPYCSRDPELNPQATGCRPAGAECSVHGSHSSYGTPQSVSSRSILKDPHSSSRKWECSWFTLDSGKVRPRRRSSCLFCWSVRGWDSNWASGQPEVSELRLEEARRAGNIYRLHGGSIPGLGD